jgi:hypothetical protein
LAWILVYAYQLDGAGMNIAHNPPNMFLSSEATFVFPQFGNEPNELGILSGST